MVAFVGFVGSAARARLCVDCPPGFNPYQRCQVPPNAVKAVLAGANCPVSLSSRTNWLVGLGPPGVSDGAAPTCQSPLTDGLPVTPATRTVGCWVKSILWSISV